MRVVCKCCTPKLHEFIIKSDKSPGTTNP
jgi:hypothetical protein